MKYVIPSILIGAMILILTTSSLAEAKPGVISVHISAKHLDGSNAGGVHCLAIGYNTSDTRVTGEHGGITNNGGKAHIDVPNGNNSVEYLIITCNNTIELDPVFPSDKGPTKVSVTVP